MPRWTGTWLQGPDVTLGELRRPDSWPGKRLGLPQEGAGSLAPFSARAFGFAVDLLACGVASGLVSAVLEDPSPSQRQGVAYAVLFLEQLVLVALTGQTLGMRLLGLRVVRLADRTGVPGLVAALLRTVPLLLTAGLAGFFTRDGRGAHDLVAGCAVVRT
jgi:uncharacterized RDD family membrane protein YckC